MKRIHALLTPILILNLLAGCAADKTNDTSSAGGTEIQFTDSKITASSSSGVTIDGTSLTITGSGTYVLSGSYSCLESIGRSRREETGETNEQGS